MSFPLMPDDFDSGTAPRKAPFKAVYNANTYGGWPDNPTVKSSSKTKADRAKLAKAQSNPKFLKAKGFKPLPGIANFPPKFRG